MANTQELDWKEQAKAGVYFHLDSIRLMDSCGVSELHEGINELTWDNAASIVAKMRRLEKSVSPYLLKRFRSYYMQIAFAFGPEFVQENIR